MPPLWTKQICTSRVEHGEEGGDQDANDDQVPPRTAMANISAPATDAGENCATSRREKAEDDVLHSLDTI